MLHSPKSPIPILFGLLLAFIWICGSLGLTVAQPLSPPVSNGAGPWTNFSTGDGLAHENTLSLALRPDGVLLVGTAKGLSALLPSGDWLTFGEKDGLSGQLISRILLDPTDPQRVWIATENGATLLDDGGNLADRDAHAWINFGTKDGMAGDNVVDIVAAQDGRIWFANNQYVIGSGEVGVGVSVLDYANTPFDKSDDIWTVYTTSNSDLANNAVRRIAQADDGVIWIATRNGLNAVSDGLWTTYYVTDGLPGNEVADVLPVGNLLWVATPNGLGLIDTAGTPHDKRDDRTENYGLFKIKGFDPPSIGPLALDSAGVLWISLMPVLNPNSVGEGVWVIDTNGTLFDLGDDRHMHFNDIDPFDYQEDGPLSSGEVFDLIVPARPGDSTVWFATSRGVNRFDFGASPFSAEDDHWAYYSSEDRLPGATVFSVADAGFGVIYVGSDAGLSRLNYNATPHDKHDDLWNRLELEAFDYEIPEGVALSLRADTTDRLWVGMTNGLAGLGGLDKFEYFWDDYSIFYDSTSGLADNQVNDIEIDRAGGLWLATGELTRGGLQRLDLGADRFSRNDDSWVTFAPHNSPAMPAYAVADIAIDKNGDVWLATSKGAARLDYNDTPELKRDDVWYVYTPSNSGLAYEAVRSVVIDGQGNAWFGLNIGGVSVLTPQGAWTTFTQADGLVYDSVSRLALDSKGRLWIGTDGGGVSVLDAGGSPLDKSDDVWTTYSADNELLSGNIRAIHFDEIGQGWIGTFGGGLTVYSEQSYRRSYLPLVFGSESIFWWTPTPTVEGLTRVPSWTPTPARTPTPYP